MSTFDPKVNGYIEEAKRWQKELRTLRSLILDCRLTEEFKWRIPVYTYENSNIVSISALKDCCVLSFFKGALLKDPQGILSKPGENSRAARVLRFTSVQEITALEQALKNYVHEAVDIEKAGLKVDFKKDLEIDIPEELQSAFRTISGLQTAFSLLTPGRQRGYLLHFSAPKQSKTRTARIEKYAQQILDGKGLHDCTCGLSKKFPACDGSHKSLR